MGKIKSDLMRNQGKIMLGYEWVKGACLLYTMKSICESWHFKLGTKCLDPISEVKNIFIILKTLDKIFA
jgi:hypothetical protein